jgi:hypothetical protein
MSGKVNEDGKNLYAARILCIEDTIVMCRLAVPAPIYARRK